MREEPPFNFHKTVPRYRRELKISQQELAQMCGISIHTLMNIESGRNINPRIGTIARIAHELDVSVDTLMGLR